MPPPAPNKVQRVSSGPTSVCFDAMSSTTASIGARRSESSPPSEQGTLVSGFFGRVHSLTGPRCRRLSLSGLYTLHCQDQGQDVSVTIGSHGSNETGTNSVATATTVAKDISFWGGLCLLICNTTGPGVVTLPLVAQSAGWVPTVFGFALVGVLSYLSSLFVCEAMTEVPGNERYQANVEFSNMVLCFFGRRYQVLVQIICFLAMQTTNIASIAICAQLFDNLLIRIAHRTCGIQVYPNAAFVCVSEQLPSASPFSGTLIMSTGALLAMILIVPLCLLNLSENIWLQIGSCILILLIFVQWIVTFFQHGLDTSRVPAVGADMSQAFGSILFNYAFITAVPSWANAKQSHVSPHKTVGSNVSLMTILFVLVSVLGGMAFAIPENSTMIQAISSSSDVTTLSQIAGYTFPIAALVTSIPINMIVLRYNLIQSKTCRKAWANAMAGGLPWLVAIPCMTGSGLTNAVGWSSLFLVSSANFVIPFVLYIYSKKYRARLMAMTPADRAIQERLDKELCGTLTVGEAAEVARLSAECEVRHSEQSSEITQSEDGDNEVTGGHGVSTDMAMEKHGKGHGAVVVAADTLECDFHDTKHLHSPDGQSGSRDIWNEKDSREDLNASGESLTEFVRSGSADSETGLQGVSSCKEAVVKASETSITVTGMELEVKSSELRHRMLYRPENDLAIKAKDGSGVMRAIPLSSPVSGLAVAYCALTLLLIGIGATIIIKIVQLA
ncbi:hypothetical protein K457DRAFT_17843 [Linnemannia elongata AG-77]|uniref:Amino acid transporter transmembrane domain-containing protein n=1 Tax=Linnemannia elongata AG-77 TaxID=1314771 RepID=A0A197K081_9FUNG|nr:hypothetical protein K457DRAFT_17843 [Linnemannia elongata AG-77]